LDIYVFVYEVKLSYFTDIWDKFYSNTIFSQTNCDPLYIA